MHNEAHYVQAITAPTTNFLPHRLALDIAPCGVLHENPKSPVLTYKVRRDDVDALMDRLADWPGLNVEAMCSGPYDELQLP